MQDDMTWKGGTEGTAHQKRAGTGEQEGSPNCAEGEAWAEGE